MSDLYFDADWESDHPYLAALWRKLLSSPQRCLVASLESCELFLTSMGPGSRVVLQWDGTTESGLAAADDLSGLFSKVVNEGLAFEINDRSVPLESWF